MKKIAKRSRDKRIDQRGPSCVPSFVQNSESNKASYRSKGKKKKAAERTERERDSTTKTLLLIVILSRGPCPRPIRHVLPSAEVYDGEFCLLLLPLPIERMLSNRWMIGNWSEAFVSRFKKFPTISLVYLMSAHCLRSFCSSRCFTRTIERAARSVFVVQKGSGRGL